MAGVPTSDIYSDRPIFACKARIGYIKTRFFLPSEQTSDSSSQHPR